MLELLKTLTEHRLGFVLVGGMAAAAHGSALVTEDVDVCIRFDLQTLERLLVAVQPYQPRQRMAPDRPLLNRTASELVGWRNLYLATTAGQLDLLGEVTGVGSYEAVEAGAISLDLGGFTCRVMGLTDLIRAKRAMGRPKDLRAVLELETLLARNR